MFSFEVKINNQRRLLWKLAQWPSIFSPGVLPFSGHHESRRWIDTFPIFLFPISTSTQPGDRAVAKNNSAFAGNENPDQFPGVGESWVLSLSRQPTLRTRHSSMIMGELVHTRFVFFSPKMNHLPPPATPFSMREACNSSWITPTRTMLG